LNGDELVGQLRQYLSVAKRHPAQRDLVYRTRGCLKGQLAGLRPLPVDLPCAVMPRAKSASEVCAALPLLATASGPAASTSRKKTRA
jgi:hypothetical protein